MTKEEFLARAARQEDWAPGWEAIDACIESVYPGSQPHHFGTDLHARALFGGNQYLDGYSLYHLPEGYIQLLTYGMTVLYVNEEAFGGEESGWGYEMTMKLPEAPDEECMWGIDLFAKLARYTYTSNRFFEAYQLVSTGGNPIKPGADTQLTAFLVVPDTTLPTIDTLYGRVEFLQLVGITRHECDVLAQNKETIPALVEQMRKADPLLVTDLARKNNML